MIPSEEKKGWHSLAVRKLSTLLRGITSNKLIKTDVKKYMKSDKMPYIIYADIKSLIRKINGRENNPWNSSIIKIGEHIPCEYSMPEIWGFDHIE